MEMQAAGSNNRMPQATGVHSQSALQLEVRAAVDNLNWPPLASRGWSPLPSTALDERGAEGIEVGRGKKLKVLSWNVLCDGLSGAHPTRGGFLKAPKGSLDWEKRRWKILEEILKWDCDVLVLQEVDHHHDWLSPMLAKEGYRSLFVKKPIAPGIAFNPHLEDGCSLFYRAKVAAPSTAATATSADEGRASDELGKAATTTRAPTMTLDLLDAHTFTLAIVEEDDSAEDGKGAGDDGKDGPEKSPAEPVPGNQVAIISLLSVSAAGGVDGCNAGGETLVIVSTTHLKAVKNAHGETIRARQAKQLLDEVARFRAGHEQARGLPAGSIPLVIAGDFNATPRSSGGYEPLCYRQVTAHPLALQSALPTDEGFFTTWKIRPANKPQGEGSGVEGATRESKHCIDYMWVSGGVRPMSGSSLPSPDELGPTKAPSFVYPSDHFAIAVDLRLP
eukprot:g11929.t3